MYRTMTGAALVAVAFGAAGCARAGSETAAAPAPRILTVDAADFSYSAPDTIPAGLTIVRMANRGREVHHMQIMRLDAGRTLQDVMAFFAAPGPVPAWVHHEGGPGAVIPGDTSEVQVVLQPGDYVLLCYVPSADGVPHLAKGMVRPITVIASDAPAAPLPVADVVMVLDNYRFDLSGALHAGRQTIEVTNAADQFHEVLFVQLAPGKTAQDMVAWELGGQQGPPPGRPIGGPVGLDRGLRNWFTVDLAPGTYALICYYPDAGDGRPHVAHGMMRELIVN